MPSRSRRHALVGATLCAAALATLCGGGVLAHEIGTTRVSVLLHEGRTYEVEVVTDARALVEKLEAAAGRPPPADTNPSGLASWLAGGDDTFRRRVTLAFDGADVRPAIAYSVSSGIDALSSPVATIRLTGPIPPGARSFTWAYGWTFASYALTVRRAPADPPATQWLEGDQRTGPLPLSAAVPRVDRLATAWRHFTLGFTHIVPDGLDHVLFVLGIFLLSRDIRSVLWQVSAFTIAHSITLGLSMYGILAAPSRLVEPLIALSIVYVAVENILVAELNSWRVALVFMFGLLHGLGFAKALADLGLPRSEFVTALLTFNLGVEAGQLAVLGAAFLLVGWPCARRPWYRSRVVVPLSLLIACAGLYWTIRRLSS